MKKVLLPTAFACLLLATACNKDDDDDIVIPQPQPTSVNGYFSIGFDSTFAFIDSLKTYYLKPDGVLDSNVYTNVYEWRSPARRYDSGDSAYAKARAWGRTKKSGTTVQNMPEMKIKFSEQVSAQNASSPTSNSIKNGQLSVNSAYGFRLK